jgi:hypothetical protein
MAPYSRRRTAATFGRLARFRQELKKLGFCGIQAFSANTAIVMSSGKGALSRLYKTTDGCHTGKLIFPNPYAPDGFFDAILFPESGHGILFGDPVRLA